MNERPLPNFDWSQLTFNSARILIICDRRAESVGRLERVCAQIVLAQARSIAPRRLYSNVSHNTAPKMRDLAHLDQFQRMCERERTGEPSLAIVSLCGLNNVAACQTHGLRELLRNGRFHRTTTIVQLETLGGFDSALLEQFDYMFVLCCAFSVAQALYAKHSTPSDSPNAFHNLHRQLCDAKSDEIGAEQPFVCLAFVSGGCGGCGGGGSGGNAKPAVQRRSVFCAQIVNRPPAIDYAGWSTFAWHFGRAPLLESVAATLAWLEMYSDSFDNDSCLIL